MCQSGAVFSFALPKVDRRKKLCRIPTQAKSKKSAEYNLNNRSRRFPSQSIHEKGREMLPEKQEDGEERKVIRTICETLFHLTPDETRLHLQRYLWL